MEKNSHVTVLVVEDDALSRLLITAACHDAGMVVFEAGNVDDALAILHQEPIEVLLTDVQMPGCRDGLDLARMAPNIQPGLAIIVTSGEVRAVTAYEFVAKPYNCDDVVQRILHAA